MTRKTAVIKNSAGIHVRPSGVIFEEVNGYPGKIEITFNGDTHELNSIMTLLAMGLVNGSKVEITVEGPDEEDKSEKLKNLFETEFDFPPR